PGTQHPQALPIPPASATGPSHARYRTPRLNIEPIPLERLLELDAVKGMFNDRRSLLDEYTQHSDRVLDGPELAVLEYERRQAVEDMVFLLPARDSEIIRRRHGWYTDEPETLDAIGQVFGVSRERIRQIEKKAMTALTRFVQGDSAALLDYAQFTPRSKSKKKSV
ncbi:DNA-directed RNA polymerase sigma subunit (sigma70/sigma32), partial [Brevibacterium pityocampae]